MVEGSTHRAE